MWFHNNVMIFGVESSLETLVSPYIYISVSLIVEFLYFVLYCKGNFEE